MSKKYIVDKLNEMLDKRKQFVELIDIFNQNDFS